MHKRTTLKLFCQFSGSELEEKGQELSAAMLTYDEIEDRKKSATKQYSDSLKALRGQMRYLSKAIRKKGQEAEVECFIRFHQPAIGSKETVRTDTGELVCTEAMTPEECQDNLFGEINELNNLWGAGPTPEPPPPTEEPPSDAASA